jgi:drug/metabolite transporter (DMT)-like permease
VAFRPNLPLLITVLSWGFNFVALKLLYAPDQMTAPSVGLVRFIGMYVMLLALCSLRGESLRYPKGDVLRILFMGFLAMGVYMYFFLEGMKGSTAAEGAIILATSPIFTAIFAAIAGQEKFNKGALLGAVLAFLGVVIVIMAGVQHAQQEKDKLLGNILILISSVIWAGSTVYSRPLVEKYSPFRVLTLSMPGALLVLLPYGLLPSLAVDWQGLKPITWWMLAHVALMAGVVGFAGFYAGVRQIGAPGAMLYQYFVPPTAAFCAWLVLGQPMQPLQLVGLLVVLSGVALAMHFRYRAALQAAAPP